MTVPPYVLRSMVPDDEAFIFTSWIKGFHQVTPMNFCPSSVYLPQQRLIITRLLETATTLVACLPEKPDDIIGYIVYEIVGGLMVVHWMYVKSLFRHNTVATSILQSLYPGVTTDPIVVTHNFNAFRDVRHRFNIQYDPYFLINRMNQPGINQP
jgi:hypothetical protein